MNVQLQTRSEHLGCHAAVTGYASVDSLPGLPMAKDRLAGVSQIAFGTGKDCVDFSSQTLHEPQPVDIVRDAAVAADAGQSAAD